MPYGGCPTPDADRRGLRAYGAGRPRDSRGIPEHGRGGRPRSALSGAPRPLAPYSPALNPAFSFSFPGEFPPPPPTGQLVSGGIAAETRQVFSNLGAILNAAGASFDRVVKATVYLS